MKKFYLPKRLAALALTVGLATMPAAAFTDTQDHWARDAIDRWSETYGLINGYENGTFRPDASITRGAFAGILDRFLKFKQISEADTFSDTAGTYWESAILKLHAAGVYQGNGGKALSGSTITRQQAVTMIARAFHITASEYAYLPYRDAGQIASYAQEAVAEMTGRGYITDCPNQYFRPTDPITRAELVNILDNMVLMLIQDAETYTGAIPGTVMVNSTEGANLKNMHISGDLILAPGVDGKVTMNNVIVEGSVRNFSDVVPKIVDSSKELDDDRRNEDDEEEEEEKPAIRPEEVYEATDTKGTFLYDGKEIPIYKDVEKLKLDESEFYWDGDRLIYDGRRYDTRFGIDVSAYQNRATEDGIDWEAVADDGVDFVMVRVGLRGYTSGLLVEDAFYRENIEGALDAGLETGVYLFSQAITVEEAIEEAEFLLELIEDYDIDGPVVYDWEMHNSSYRVYGIDPAMATACAVAFCETIEKAGYDPMVYAGKYVSYIKYDMGALNDYLLWYPEYKDDSSESLCPTYFYQMDYWQFSSSCTVDGIGGEVDGNLQFIR